MTLPVPNVLTLNVVWCSFNIHLLAVMVGMALFYFNVTLTGAKCVPFLPLQDSDSSVSLEWQTVVGLLHLFDFLNKRSIYVLFIKSICFGVYLKAFALT